MHYEINVSLNGEHVFATHKRSISNHFAAQRVFNIIRNRFPASEGFAVSISYDPGEQYDHTAKFEQEYFAEHGTEK